MEASVINKILGIKEAYKMSDVLLTKLLDEKQRNKLFDEFMNIGESLDHDWFVDYFQEEHGDRKNLKQDFTPDSVCTISNGMLKKGNTLLDMCSGTGALTLKNWQKENREEYKLIEFSERTVPTLLFNLAIRNIDATVYNGDALTREVFKAYKLTSSERYSAIELIETDMEFKVDDVITNPPYSLKWDYEEFTKDEARFKEYGLPPKTKSDYAFILDGLSRLKENGVVVAIVPHGVLFRGSAEGKIRQKLIEDNLIDTIVGLPEKLFMNTGIAVCIVKLQKNRESKDIYFVDASKEFIKQNKLNYMTDKHIETVLGALNLRRDIDKLSHLASFEEVKENGFNLNISRYVDTFEPPKPIDIIAVTNEIKETCKEIKETDKQILKSMDDLLGDEEFCQARELWRSLVGEQ